MGALEGENGDECGARKPTVAGVNVFRNPARISLIKQTRCSELSFVLREFKRKTKRKSGG